MRLLVHTLIMNGAINQCRSLRPVDPGNVPRQPFSGHDNSSETIWRTLQSPVAGSCQQVARVHQLKGLLGFHALHWWATMTRLLLTKCPAKKYHQLSTTPLLLQPSLMLKSLAKLPAPTMSQKSTLSASNVCTAAIVAHMHQWMVLNSHRQQQHSGTACGLHTLQATAEHSTAQHSTA